MNVLRCQHHDPVLTAKHNHLCCFIFYLCGKRLKKKKKAGGFLHENFLAGVFDFFSTLCYTVLSLFPVSLCRHTVQPQCRLLFGSLGCAVFLVAAA